MKYSLLPILLLVASAAASAQQLPDTAFIPEIDNPSYPAGNGPVIMIDEAHNNFHTMGDRYFVFAELFCRDGYRVQPGTGLFTESLLKTADVLVISNAIHESNIDNWSLPTPSAFTTEEIAAVKRWVENGGSLFLIADHMPFPGAAQDLASALGFDFVNGYAIDVLHEGPAVFSRAAGTLGKHHITDGYTPNESIDSVASFTGSAFEAKIPCTPVLTLDSGFVMYMTETAMEFDDSTKTSDAEGLLQGAVAEIGNGRVAVFGEAAMFTAQIAMLENGEQFSFGMSRPVASQNLPFLRNIMRWLSRWNEE